jgi:DNA-binding transcriptional LysR family regulator
MQLLHKFTPAFWKIYLNLLISNSYYKLRKNICKTFVYDIIYLKNRYFKAKINRSDSPKEGGNMDFSYYKNFIVIVETGSISAAAKKLNLAQSALSTQVKRIEEDYGAKLLRMGRGQRTLELTEAGRVFFKQAKYLCSVDDTTRTEINNCAAGLSGTLKISVSPALAPYFIKSYLQAFCKLYPQIQYQIYEVPVEEQVKQLEAGFTDLGVANAPLPEPHLFQVIATKRRNFFLVAREENRWIRKADHSLKFEDLQNIPLSVNFASLPVLEAAGREHNFQPYILLSATTRNSPLAFAAAGQYLYAPYPPTRHSRWLTPAWPLRERKSALQVFNDVAVQ